jgi:hypothetical protein
MKTASVIALTSVALVCLTTAGANPEVGQSAFDPVQEQGNTRVTLLHFSRMTSFLRRNHESTDSLPVTPGIEIVYLVEQLGSEPDERVHNSFPPKLLVSGERLQEVEGVVAGGESLLKSYSDTSFSYGFEMPAVAAPERARLVRNYMRGLTTDSDRVDLQIATGFGELLTFKFRDVPLSSAGG